MRELLAARTAVDRRWALLMGADPDLLRRPGIHFVETDPAEDRGWMRYIPSFVAIRPSENLDVTVVAASAATCETTRRALRDAGRIGHEQVTWALYDVACGVGAEQTYVCELHVGVAGELRLDEDDDGIVEYPAGSPDAADWNGKLISTEMDGPIFAVHDAAGMASFAGIRRVSPWAQNTQVATRADARRRGLGRRVSSAAFRRLLAEGITPFYSHDHDNLPSAAHARALGFRPYGWAVIAESRLPPAASSDQ